MINKIIFKRSIAFAMTVLVVLSTFTIFVAAEKVVPDGIKASNVCDDLETMGYDLSDYPRDESANFISVIDFTEFGYHYSGDQRYFGLYIYVYNPSGKKLSTTGNAVELSFNHKDTGETGYVKYNLRVMSVSADAGNEYVFYKFFVNNSSAIGANVGKYRMYKLSSIELQYEEKGVSKAKSFKIGGSYAFTGYQDNFGPSGSNLPLHCNYSTIEVIDVELHGASWYTDTSDLGEDYRYEVSSVYFNIPNYYINKYGNLEDETSGLYSVQGVYSKSVTNGLVVQGSAYSDFESYEQMVLSAQSGYKNYSVGSGFGFYSLQDSYMQGTGVRYTSDISFNYSLKTYSNIFQVIDVRSKYPIDQILHIVKGDSYSDEISQEVWLSEYSTNRSVWNSALKLAVMKDLSFGDLGRQRYFDITVKDNSLNESIKSYADKVGYSQASGDVKRWLMNFFLGDLLSDAEGYDEIKPIVEINTGIFGPTSGIYDIEAIAEDLFLTKEDAEGLKSFVSANGSDSHIYLMRFEVNPYYSKEVILTNNVNDVSPDGYDHKGLYFEKVVFSGFDILSFTFKDVAGIYKTVPVSCDPIDIIGSIVPEPEDDNGFDKIKNDVLDNYNSFKKLFDNVISDITSLNDFLRSILIFCLIAVLIALLILAIKYGSAILIPIARGIGGVFSWLGSAFAWIFGKLGSAAKWTYTNVDKFKDKALAAISLKGDYDNIRSKSKEKRTAKREQKKQKREERRNKLEIERRRKLPRKASKSGQKVSFSSIHAKKPKPIKKHKASKQSPKITISKKK